VGNVQGGGGGGGGVAVVMGKEKREEDEERRRRKKTDTDRWRGWGRQENGITNSPPPRENELFLKKCDLIFF
jgi:hypothetical protein